MHYWNVKYNDKEYETETENLITAVKWIEEHFAEECRQDGMRNGETQEGACELIEYEADDNGNIKEINRVPYALSYEHYHGDYTEHNTLWGL